MNTVTIPFDLAVDILHRLPHAEGCQQLIFTKHNASMPPQHPVWEHRPDCDCHVARLATAMKQQLVADLNEPLDTIDNL